MGLNDIGAAYWEGLAADRFGVDWRQKRAMLEAQTRGVNASTAKTDADTKLTGVQTQDAQFDLQEKQRRVTELKQLVASGRLPATQLEAVKALIAVGEDDIRKSMVPYEQKHLQAQTNQANATAEYMRRRPAEGATQGWKQVMMNGKLVWYNFLTGETRNTPEGMSDLATGRKDIENLRAMGSFDNLLMQADNALARYEQHFKGFERITPSFLNPDKAVAKQAYESKLAELAQVFGRSVLRDQRVSDQDMARYSAAIGQFSEPLMTYDPKEARRRLNDLRALQEDYKLKYPNPNINLQPAGAPVTPGENNIDTILDRLFPPRK